ncbi:MAG: hypothetical protein WCO26_17885, partial [Deltaproteobacteria bacterium]
PEKRFGCATMRSFDDCLIQRRLCQFSEKTCNPQERGSEKGQYDSHESRRTRGTSERKFSWVLQRTGEKKFPDYLPLLPYVPAQRR